MPPCPSAPEAAAAHASVFAWQALANIQQEYPNKLDHVIKDAADVQAPHVLHPLFYGSYDWHSCVHMHWLLARLLRLFPDLPEAAQIRALLDTRFTDANVAAEVAYLREPGRETFERPYGWAWLLKLQTELIELARSESGKHAWVDALRPLADLLTERYLHFLPLAQYPVRAGTHANSAFGLLFALDYAECVQHLALRKLIVDKANIWFGRDRRYPAWLEPGGEDFLSPGLVEAALMSRVLDACDFADWWEVFCPTPQDLQVWLSPVAVADRQDARIVHLDGLNLSRAWCWKLLEAQLPQSLREPVRDAIEAHLAASLPFASSGDYVGTHWLASFALLALSQGQSGGTRALRI